MGAVEACARVEVSEYRVRVLGDVDYVEVIVVIVVIEVAVGVEVVAVAQTRAIVGPVVAQVEVVEGGRGASVPGGVSHVEGVVGVRVFPGLLFCDGVDDHGVPFPGGVSCSQGRVVGELGEVVERFRGGDGGGGGRCGGGPA